MLDCLQSGYWSDFVERPVAVKANIAQYRLGFTGVNLCYRRIIPPAVGVLPRGYRSRAQDFQLCQDQMQACRNKPPRRHRP